MMTITASLAQFLRLSLEAMANSSPSLCNREFASTQQSLIQRWRWSCYVRRNHFLASSEAKGQCQPMVEDLFRQQRLRPNAPPEKKQCRKWQLRADHLRSGTWRLRTADRLLQSI